MHPWIKDQVTEHKFNNRSSCDLMVVNFPQACGITVP